METQLNAINTQLGTLQSDCETAVADVNAKITDYNTKVDAAQAAANTSKTQIANAISALQAQLNATTDESVRDQISTAITALQNAPDCCRRTEQCAESICDHGQCTDL